MTKEESGFEQHLQETQHTFLSLLCSPEEVIYFTLLISRFHRIK